MAARVGGQPQPTFAESIKKGAGLGVGVAYGLFHLWKAYEGSLCIGEVYEKGYCTPDPENRTFDYIYYNGYSPYICVIGGGLVGGLTGAVQHLYFRNID